MKNDERKSKVLELILKSPGVRYRQLLRLTGLPNGSLYHLLKKLEKSRRIVVDRSRNNRVTSYYPKNIKATELQILANLRNNTETRIVQFLLKQGQSTFNDIVNHSEKAPSTISWYLNRLKNGKLITTNPQRRRPRAYKIINQNNVARIVSKYKK